MQVSLSIYELSAMPCHTTESRSCIWWTRHTNLYFLLRSIGMDVEYQEGFKVQCWDGEPDQRDAAIFRHQGTFHPTKYVGGVLK